MSDLEVITNCITRAFIGETGTATHNRARALHQLTGCFSPATLDLEFRALVSTAGPPGIALCKSRIYAAAADCAKAAAYAYGHDLHESRAATMCLTIARHVVEVEIGAAAKLLATEERMQYITEEACRVLNIAKLAWAAAMTGIELERAKLPGPRQQSQQHLDDIETAFSALHAAAE